MRRPTQIDGSALGTTTVRMIVARASGPSSPRPASSVGFTRLAPAIVLTTIGKNAAYATIMQRRRRAGAEPQDRERKDRDRRDRPEALDERIEVALDRARASHREPERDGDAPRRSRSQRTRVRGFAGSPSAGRRSRSSSRRSSTTREGSGTRWFDCAIAHACQTTMQRDRQHRAERQSLPAQGRVHDARSGSGAHGVNTLRERADQRCRSGSRAGRSWR